MKKLPVDLTILMPGNNFSLQVVESIVNTQKEFENVSFRIRYEPSIYAVRNSLLGGNPTYGKKQKPDIATPYVLWIDSDCVWKPDDVEKILNDALVNDLKIVSGWCVINTPENNISPFILATENPIWSERKTFTQSGMRLTTNDLENLPDIFRVRFVGGHFALMKTEIFNDIEYPWFCPILYSNYGIDNNFIGEDVALCYKAWKELGVECYVNKTVKVGHQKLRTLGEEK